MSNFPSAFEEQTTLVTRELVSAGGAEAIDQLASAGYEVHAGLTPEFADQIIAMALEPGIRRYCPRDCAERFADRSAVEQWLAKQRGTFLLLKKSESGSRKVVGYGWVGAGTSQHVAEGETTFALRIGESGQGQGLATPFSKLIVEAAAALYGARKIWLETSASNAAAVHVYHKIGFRDVGQKAIERAELDGEKVADIRLYMFLPDEALLGKNDAALSSDS